MPQDSEERRVSVLIAGFGAAGAALALGLVHAGAPVCDILICDPAPDTPPLVTDTRVMALNPRSIAFLKSVGIGEEIDAAANPLRSIALTDTSLHAIVRPLLLGIEDQSGAPLAQMLPLGALQTMLRARVRAAEIPVRQAGVTSFQADAPGGASVQLSDGTSITARLIAAVDGARSQLREKAGISIRGWRYGQSAISALIRHSAPHGGEAVQHFLPGGTFALLPLDEGRSSIVWSEEAERASMILGNGPQRLHEEISLRCAGWRGEITAVEAHSHHPLSLQLARNFIAQRLALVADAAHVVHPLAGQGLNLGLMDAECLAQRVADHLKIGLDPGSPECLEAYQAERRPPAVGMAAATDALNRLFSNDDTGLRLFRDVGMGLVQRSEAVKSALRKLAGAIR